MPTLLFVVFGPKAQTGIPLGFRFYGGGGAGDGAVNISVKVCVYARVCSSRRICMYVFTPYVRTEDGTFQFEEMLDAKRTPGILLPATAWLNLSGWKQANSLICPVVDV